MLNLPPNKKIILFDGVCNLCNSAVQFIIKRDSKDVFRFAALQSKIGQEICDYIALDSRKMDSIILYEPGKAYNYKSEAALKIASQLGFFYSLSLVFKIIPERIRNHIYDYVARNRYRWFGKKDACMIPTRQLKDKFLE
tara:strand:+ start:33 stop:449 length:417 start_codon:yes stop_codon:yes gene_type:complete